MLFIWSQGVPEALMKAGAVYKYDLSLPVEKMYDLVEAMRIRLGNLIIFAINNILLYSQLGAVVRYLFYLG